MGVRCRDNAKHMKISVLYGCRNAQGLENPPTLAQAHARYYDKVYQNKP